MGGNLRGLSRLGSAPPREGRGARVGCKSSRAGAREASGAGALQQSRLHKLLRFPEARRGKTPPSWHPRGINFGEEDS
ncbi:unnamed protein product [Caretta caretta]